MPPTLETARDLHDTELTILDVVAMAETPPVARRAVMNLQLDRAFIVESALSAHEIDRGPRWGEALERPRPRVPREHGGRRVMFEVGAIRETDH